jgi:hypothetical protein
MFLIFYFWIETDLIKKPINNFKANEKSKNFNKDLYNQLIKFSVYLYTIISKNWNIKQNENNRFIQT